MENSELETLKPCLNPTFNFPPHRRRPLQSQTYRTFVRILSQCNALEPFLEPKIPDDGGDKLALGTEQNALVDKSFMELESSLVREMSPLDAAKEFDAYKDVGEVTLNAVNSLDVIGTVKQVNEKLTPENDVCHLDSSMVSNQSIELEIGKKFSPRREQKEFHEPFVNEVPDSVNASRSMEVIADMPRPVGYGNEASPISVVNLSEEIEHELQLKQKELEKLIPTSGSLDLSDHDFADEEIEEGEISGGFGVDEAIDLLFEDDVSLEKEKLDEVLVSEDDERELLNCDGGDGQQGKYGIRSSLLLDKVDGGNDTMQQERSIWEEQGVSAKFSGGDVALKCTDEHDAILETGRNAEQVGCVKETNPLVISLENLAQRGQITYDDITENGGSVTAEMEVSVGKKKRGPLTKERRAKKKKKDRIKRAEKNKKLGVRRLKLEPVLKPKKVVYCRHYLQGRCQEGEKCKFSHDTTPLTKSTPCSFFARHSCMKGENCPFDHQLSKYTCNNVVTRGFCSRGADCFFKHEISSKDDTTPISKLSKPELKPPLLTSDLNSKKQVNKEGIRNQDMHTKFSTVENSTSKFSENQMPKIVENPIAHVPKGICLISHVRSPTANTSRHEEAASCLNMDNSVRISNETGKGMPLRLPKGINFLSSGKSPLDDSLNKEIGASGSLLGQLTKAELDGLKIGSQIGITSSEAASVVNIAESEASSVSTPRGIKFLSAGSIPVDKGSAVRQSKFGYGNVNSSTACIQEKKIDGVEFSRGPLHGSAAAASCSSSLLLQSLDQSGAGNCGGNSASSKTPLLLNTPTSVQRALQTTLAFAAKMDSEIKLGRPMDNSSSTSRHIE